MVSSPFLLALIPLATGQIIAMGLLESGIHAKATQLSQAPNRDTKKPQPLFVEEHIVAGTKAEPTEFPWIVKSASPASVCTAALIHEGKIRL